MHVSLRTLQPSCLGTPISSCYVGGSAHSVCVCGVQIPAPEKKKQQLSFIKIQQLCIFKCHCLRTLEERLCLVSRLTLNLGSFRRNTLRF